MPKKRGPKTDVLETLLKRVDGLERRMQTGNEQGADDLSVTAVKKAILDVRSSNSPQDPSNSHSDASKATSNSDSPPEHRGLSRTASALPSVEYAALLIDTYFTRMHGKPYHILDEMTSRDRLLTGQAPAHLIYAVFAVSARFAKSLSARLA